MATGIIIALLIAICLTAVKSYLKDTQQTVRTYRKINQENKAKDLSLFMG